MPRPQRNWKSVTMTLSPEVTRALREAAQSSRQYMGTITDQVLREKLLPPPNSITVTLTTSTLEIMFATETLREIESRWHDRKEELAEAIKRPDETTEAVLREMDTWTASRIPKSRQQSLMTVLSAKGYVPVIVGYLVEHDFFEGPDV